MYRRCDNIGAVFASETDFGVEGADFHDEGNSIEMIKSIWNIHYF